MEAASLLPLSSSSPKTHLHPNARYPNSSLQVAQSPPCSWKPCKFAASTGKNRTPFSASRHTLQLPPSPAVAEAVEQAPVSVPSPSPELRSPKLDKNGRFCSPRASREHALLILYASCLEGSDPVRLFDRRVNAKRVPGYLFEKDCLLEYNHMKFAGDPVSVQTEEEAAELTLIDERESANEEEVLSAPPKLVYNKFSLHSTRELLEAVVSRWDQHVVAINKISPPSWKGEPAGRILELCILHLAMAEMTVVGTKHQIVINEAVDLAKRFCDGTAPRIINGCLRTFVRSHESGDAQEAKS